MAELGNSKVQSSIFSLHTVTPWLLVTILGVATVRPFMSSDRPSQMEEPTETEKTAVKSESPTYQPMKVRLWQDPFHGLQKLRKIQSDIPTVRDLLKKSPTKDKGDGPLLFLFACVGDGYDNETIEQRRRERFALLSALSTAHYCPVTSERLNHVSFDIDHVRIKEGTSAALEGSQTKEGAKRSGIGEPNQQSVNQRVAPYEWFRPLLANEWPSELPAQETPVFAGVCIIWLDTLATSSDRLSGVLALIRDIKYHYQHVSNSNGRSDTLSPTDVEKKPYKLNFVINGKLGTGDARSMADYLVKHRKGVEPPNLSSKQVIIGVPWITLADLGINEKALETLSKLQSHQLKIIATHSTVEALRQEVQLFEPREKGYYLCGGVPFYFPMGTDDQLAQLLRKELDSRYLRPWDLNSVIDLAIFAEADSEYGRRMILTYQQAFTPDKYNVEPHTYLQGLDGVVPTSSKEGAETKEKPSKASPILPNAAFAEGDRQFDHVMRIIDEMKRSKKKYRAIGILGSDTYDKLLLLKALRPSFPEAIFFSTDLDARFLQPGDWSHTHHLLIASHYDLKLDSKIQNQSAPFRYVYDTASYLSCLWVLGYKRDIFNQELAELIAATKSQLRQRSFGPERFARMYEVGRFGAYPLSFSDYSVDPLRPHEERALWSPSLLEGMVIAVFLVISGVILSIFSQDFRRLLGITFQQASALGKYVFLMIMAGLALLILIYYSHRDPFGEPFSWAQGISVWPTNILRLVVIFLSIYLLFFRIRGELERRRCKLMGYLHHQAFVEQEETVSKHSSDSFEKQSRFLCLSTSWWRSQIDLSLNYWKSWPEKSLEKNWSAWRAKNPSRAEACEKKHNDPMNGSTPTIPLQHLLNQALLFGRWSQRLARTTLLFLMNLILITSLIYIFGYPTTPARGLLAHISSMVFFFLSEPVAVLFLLLFVVDTTLLTYRFLGTFLDKKNHFAWPAHLFETMPHITGTAGKPLKKNDPLNAVVLRTHTLRLRIQLIADCTYDVSKMIQYPFWVLAILLLAHSSLFDNWRWNLTQIMMASLSVGAALICAYSLQSKAKRAKHDALEELDQILLPSPLPQSSSNVETKLPTGAVRDYVLETRRAIEGMESGAFKPLIQSSIALAIFWPILGLAAPELVDFMKPLLSLF